MKRKFKNESDMHRRVKPYYEERLGLKILMDNKGVKYRRSKKFRRPDNVSVSLSDGRLWYVEEKNNREPLTTRIFDQALEARKLVSNRIYEIAYDHRDIGVEINPDLEVGMLIVTVGGVDSLVAQISEQDFKFPARILEVNAHQDNIYFREVFQPPPFDDGDDESSVIDELDKREYLGDMRGVTDKEIFLEHVPELCQVVELAEEKKLLISYKLGTSKHKGYYVTVATGSYRKNFFTAGRDLIGNKKLLVQYLGYINDQGIFCSDTDNLDSSWYLSCHVPKSRNKKDFGYPPGCEYSKMKSSSAVDGVSIVRLHWFNIVDGHLLSNKLIKYIEEQMNKLRK